MTLEERVTALEQAIQPAGGIQPAHEDLDPGQARDLETQLRDTLGNDTAARYGIRVLPPGRLLTPELARELAREYVTIVQPGETLIIRIPDTWTMQQMDEAQRYVNRFTAHRGTGAAILFIPGDEFAIARDSTACCAAGRETSQ